MNHPFKSALSIRIAWRSMNPWPYCCRQPINTNELFLKSRRAVVIRDSVSKQIIVVNHLARRYGPFEGVLLLRWALYFFYWAIWLSAPNLIDVSTYKAFLTLTQRMLHSHLRADLYIASALIKKSMVVQSCLCVHKVTFIKHWSEEISMVLLHCG